MSTSITRPRTEAKPKTERPKVYKVILLNDDYTPREFVVMVLRAVFRMTTDQALGVMLTAHKRGVCVVAVYTREIAETKATQAIDMAAREGYPLCSPPSRRSRDRVRRRGQSTTRSVRLIRPPSGRRREEPGRMRSMPW